MIENDATTKSVATESKDPGAAEDAKGQRGFLFTIIGLVVAVVAVGLASIPAIALDRPLPNPFAEQKEKEEPPVEPPAEREGGITLKYKNLSVHFGGKVPEKEPPLEPELKPEVTNDPIRWFTVSAIGCALVGLVISGVGQLREKHTAITVGSMGCCAAAITWQYFAIGIAVGAAAAAFLIILAIIGSAVSG